MEDLKRKSALIILILVNKKLAIQFNQGSTNPIQKPGSNELIEETKVYL